MFKIQNATSGSLSVGLEKGSITLPPGGFFDIEEYCSRKWIAADAMLNYLISNNHLRVAYDSEIGVSHTVVAKAVVRSVDKSKFGNVKSHPVKKNIMEHKPAIIDMSEIEDPTNDAFVVVPPKVDKPKEEKKIEDKPVEFVMEKKVEEVVQEKVADVEFESKKSKKAKRWQKRNYSAVEPEGDDIA